MIDHIEDFGKLFGFLLVLNYALIGRNAYVPAYNFFSDVGVGDTVATVFRGVIDHAIQIFRKYFGDFPEGYRFTQAGFWLASRPASSFKLAALYSVLIPAIVGTIYYTQQYLLRRPLERVFESDRDMLFHSGSTLSDYRILGPWVTLVIFIAMLAATVWLKRRVREMSPTGALVTCIILFVAFFILMPEMLWKITIRYPESAVEYALHLVLVSLPNACTPVTLFPIVLNGSLSCNYTDYDAANAFFSLLMVCFSIVFAIKIGPIRYIILIMFLQLLIYWKVAFLFVPALPAMFPNAVDLQYGFSFSLFSLVAHVIANSVLMLSFLVNGMLDHISVMYSHMTYRRLGRDSGMVAILRSLLGNLVFVGAILVLSAVFFMLGVVAVSKITDDPSIVPKAIRYLTDPQFHPVKTLWVYSFILTPLWPTFLLFGTLLLAILFRIGLTGLRHAEHRLKTSGTDKAMGYELGGVNLLIFYVTGLVALVLYYVLLGLGWA